MSSNVTLIRIVLKAGQWRISTYASTYFTCPYGEKSCVGGYTTGSDSCGTGYYGPLCSVCSSGYYYSSSLHGCRNCTNDHGASLAIWIILFIAILLLLVIYLLGQGYKISYMQRYITMLLYGTQNPSSRGRKRPIEQRSVREPLQAYKQNLK